MGYKIVICANECGQIPENEECILLESGDILCLECWETVGEILDGEVAKQCFARDIHNDWRV